MKWVELSVEAPSEYAEPLSQIFQRYGHGGVAIEERGGFNPDENETPPSPAWVTVKTYVPLDSAVEERRNQIDVGIKLVRHFSPISSLQERVIEEQEWENSWKKHFHVLRIGRRVVVVPTWREYSPGPTDVVIEMDPGMAFGTGHHPTTRMCLELLEELLIPGMNVLDVGCGSGILSIAAARLGAERVVGLDIDSIAAKVAESNVQENGMADSTLIIRGSLPNPQITTGSFDIVTANISANIVSELADDLVAALKYGGELIVSGILLGSREKVTRRLEGVGAIVKRTRSQGDWVSLVAHKEQPV